MKTMRLRKYWCKILIGLDWTGLDWIGLILGDPRAASRDNVIFSGERYFWAKVYFKSRPATRGSHACVLLK